MGMLLVSPLHLCVKITYKVTKWFEGRCQDMEIDGVYYLSMYYVCVLIASTLLTKGLCLVLFHRCILDLHAQAPEPLLL